MTQPGGTARAKPALVRDMTMEPYPYNPQMWGWWWEQQLEDEPEPMDSDPVPTGGVTPEFVAMYERVIAQDREHMERAFRRPQAKAECCSVRDAPLMSVHRRRESKASRTLQR